MLFVGVCFRQILCPILLFLLVNICSYGFSHWRPCARKKRIDGVLYALMVCSYSVVIVVMVGNWKLSIQLVTIIVVFFEHILY